MDFVKEKIPEEDQTRIDWTPFKVRPESRRNTLGFDTWVVNRETETFLVHVKGLSPDNSPEIFVFCWKGVPIRFFPSIRTVLESGREKDDIFWKFQLALPKALEFERDEIINSLRDAIEEYGYLANDRQRYHEFQIDIENINYLK